MESPLNTWQKCHKCGRRRRHRKLKQFIRIHDDDIVNLCRWLKRNGLKNDHKLCTAIFEDSGRGLLTNVTIKEDDTIISLPKSLLITQNTIFTSEMGSAIKIWKPRLKHQVAFTAFLLLERFKGYNSKWSAYICALPKKYSVPACFSNSELDFLPIKVKSKVKLAVQELRNNFHSLKAFLDTNFSFMSFTYVDFLWSWYSVNSRSVFYKEELSPFLEDDGNHIALAPFLDLLNHSFTADITAGFNQKTQCYEIQTHKNYKKYSQVFISYGPHDNSQLLMEYGFVLPGNPYDVFEFEFDFIVETARKLDHKYLDHKRKLIAQNNINKNLYCNSDGLSWNFKLCVKMLTLSWDELNSWKYTDDKYADDSLNHLTCKQLALLVVQEACKEHKNHMLKFKHLDLSTMTDHQQLAHTLSLIYDKILKKGMEELTS